MLQKKLQLWPNHCFYFHLGQLILGPINGFDFILCRYKLLIIGVVPGSTSKHPEGPNSEREEKKTDSSFT